MPEPIAEAVIDVRANTRPFADDVRRAMDERHRATRTVGGDGLGAMRFIPGGGMAMRAAQSPAGIAVMAFGLIMRAAMRAADELEKLADAFKVQAFTLAQPELAKAMAAAGVSVSPLARQQQLIDRERGRQAEMSPLAAARERMAAERLRAAQAGEITITEVLGGAGQEAKGIVARIGREARRRSGLMATAADPAPEEAGFMGIRSLDPAWRRRRQERIEAEGERIREGALHQEELRINKFAANIVEQTRAVGGVAAAGTMGGTVEYTRSGKIDQGLSMLSQIVSILRQEAGLPASS